MHHELFQDFYSIILIIINRLKEVFKGTVEVLGDLEGSGARFGVVEGGALNESSQRRRDGIVKRRSIVIETDLRE